MNARTRVSKNSDDFLYADVGGTQVRTLFRGKKSVHPSGDERAVRAALLEATGGAKVEGVVVAAAGPVRRGTTELTNLGWKLTTAKLCKWFDGAPSALLHDVEAQAYGALAAAPSKRKVLAGPLRSESDRPAMLLVPGTGIGAALLVGGRVFPTETGHAAYAPSLDVGHDYASHLRGHGDAATVETALSGRAFSQLFHFFEHEEPRFATAKERKYVQSASDANKAIVELAREGSPAGRVVVGAYATFLAEEIRNAALRIGGDVWLAGGIVSATAPAIQRAVREVFREAHPMKAWLSRVQVFHVTAPDLAFAGCAAIRAQIQ